MRAESKVYAGLTVSSTAGAVEFVDGVAEVSKAQAAALRKLPASFGVTVAEAPKVESTDPPADPPKDPDEGSKQPEGSGTVLDRPAGNASLDAWQAYAVQEGHDVTDLKQSDIRALFTE